MTLKSSSRKLSSLSANQTANIPTTIKNPERVAHRRTELIEVATKLFLERGFHNTSIRDIVRACSFNIASLYMYVSSKEDILYLVAQDLMNNIQRELEQTTLSKTSPRRSLEIGFATYCGIVDRLRRPIRLLYREVGRLPPELRSNVMATVADVVSFYERIIQEGIEQGVFRKVPARAAALQVMFSAHAIALHTREIKEIFELEDYIKYQKKSMLSGLLASGEN
ncbi:MAG: TetR/AcrR family transcriptional regulator [Rhizobiaceae bacterium]|nr:TetR/AcrR family transcriptional regulator [Rhizobiaceae bacterium]